MLRLAFQLIFAGAAAVVVSTAVAQPLDPPFDHLLRNAPLSTSGLRDGFAGSTSGTAPEEAGGLL